MPRRELLPQLESFPGQLQTLFALFPQDYRRWAPTTWEGIPSEPFTAVEQLCHIRDVEVEGYQVRLRRMVEEESPFLPSLDGPALANTKRYAEANPDTVLREIRDARQQTVELIDGLSDHQIMRRGTFEGYGDVTVGGLIHYLCSHDQQHLAGLHWLLGKIESARR